MLFLIHGWAADNSVWPEWLRNLSFEYEESNFPDYVCLEHAFLECWAKANRKITVLGWSMGGMLALELAFRHSDKIEQLLLLSTTAKFVKAADYTAGLDAAIVRNLERKLGRQQRSAQEGFYKLMFSEQEGPYLTAYLENKAESFYQLDLESLKKGLLYLREKDLRSQLSSVKIPCQIIHGSADGICLPAAAEYLQANLPLAQTHYFEGAGHILFFTQAEALKKIILNAIGGNKDVG